MGVFRRKEHIDGEVRVGKVWWVTYVVAGRQKRESSHSTNKRDALNLLALRKAQVLEGRLQLPASKPPKFEEYAGKFLETIPNPSTRRRYTCSIEQLLKHFRHARLNNITPGAIEDYKQERLSKGVRAATVNRDLAVLRRMLNLAKKRRLIGPNPFAEVEFLEERKQRRQPHILTFEEQGKLLAVAPPHLRALVVLLTETGVRVGKEGLPVKWEDIDLLNRFVTVHQSKTLAGQRQIPLTGFCVEELKRWRNLAGPDFSPYVFFNPGNPSQHLKAVPKTWAGALKKAGIPYFCIYSLRATFATRLSAAGVPDVFLGQLMGHAGGLLQTYSKAIAEYRRDAIDKLEQYRQSHAVKKDAVVTSVQ